VSKDTPQKTITVALVLCLICSIVVASAAVLLSAKQQANKAIDKQKNILAAAGLLDPTRDIAEQFQQVKTRVVDLEQGVFTDAIDASRFNQMDAAKDTSQSIRLNPEGMMLAVLFANLFAPLIDHFVVQANIKRRLARV
jgi:Na+-transporting NADH:ubiquinone oxidoreductase subunit C